MCSYRKKRRRRPHNMSRENDYTLNSCRTIRCHTSPGVPRPQWQNLITASTLWAWHLWETERAIHMSIDTVVSTSVDCRLSSVSFNGCYEIEIIIVECTMHNYVYANDNNLTIEASKLWNGRTSKQTEKMKWKLNDMLTVHAARDAVSPTSWHNSNEKKQ